MYFLQRIADNHILSQFVNDSKGVTTPTVIEPSAKWDRPHNIILFPKKDDDILNWVGKADWVYRPARLLGTEGS